MMTVYGKYKQVRNSSWQCLIDCNMTCLPMKVSSIAAKMNIGLYKYSQNSTLLRKAGLEHLMRAKGFAYMAPSGKLMIFYDDSQSRQEIRYTIAHELGHILLGHVDSNHPQGRLLQPSDPKLEKDADSFAVRILAPACILHSLQISSAEEIAALCDIPLDFARSRAKRMSELYKREEKLLASGAPSCFLRSPQERQVLSDFQSFIAAYPNL